MFSVIRQKNLFILTGIIFVATGIGYLIQLAGFSDTNIAMVYILGVFFVAARCDRAVYGMVASAASVVAFNFFFVAPQFSLRAHGKEYPITFLIMLIVAIFTSAMADQVKKQAKLSEQANAVAQREKLRADLLRAISHDLRTPLTSISGNASNLYRNSCLFSDEEKIEVYKDIYEDSMWLVNVMENLLSISRIEDGKMNIKKSPQLIDDVINEAMSLYNRKNIDRKITKEIEDEFIMANIDGRLIIQVMTNLLDNALKYSEEDIRIQVKKEKKQVLVSVEDKGEGIPIEQREKIFDMFYTGEQKAADSRRSLGVGLALCKVIIEAHDGEIRVEDGSPHGTKVVILLPEGKVNMDGA